MASTVQLQKLCSGRWTGTFGQGNANVGSTTVFDAIAAVNPQNPNLVRIDTSSGWDSSGHFSISGSLNAADGTWNFTKRYQNRTQWEQRGRWEIQNGHGISLVGAWGSPRSTYYGGCTWSRELTAQEIDQERRQAEEEEAQQRRAAAEAEQKRRQEEEEQEAQRQRAAAEAEQRRKQEEEEARRERMAEEIERRRRQEEAQAEAKRQREEAEAEAGRKREAEAGASKQQQAVEAEMQRQRDTEAAGNSTTQQAEAEQQTRDTGRLALERQNQIATSRFAGSDAQGARRSRTVSLDEAMSFGSKPMSARGRCHLKVNRKVGRQTYIEVVAALHRDVAAPLI